MNVVVFGIKAQAHNVHGLARKGDGNFGARQIAHAKCLGGGLGTLLAAHFVVVGQGPKLYAIGLGALGQCFGREGAVRHHRVAVKVGIEYGAHGFILEGSALHQKPHPPLALPFVGFQPKSQHRPGGQGFGAAKPNAVNGLALVLEL